MSEVKELTPEAAWFENVQKSDFTNADVTKVKELVGLFGVMGASPKEASYAAICCFFPSAGEMIDASIFGPKE